MSEKHVYIKTFLKKDDADEYLDKLIASHKDLTIMEADVKYINGGWRVGATFGDGQLEFKFNKLTEKQIDAIYREPFAKPITGVIKPKDWYFS